MTEKEKLLVEAARRGILPAKPAKKPGRPVGLTDFIAQGALFGFGDEIGAAGSATGGFIRNIAKTGSLGQAVDAAGTAYDTRLNEIREGLEQYRSEHPVSATATEILGGLGTGGHLAKQGLSFMNVTRPTLGQMAAAGAAEGAAYGGAYGFGTGEGGFRNRLESAGVDAALGALTGGAVGAVGARMASRAAKRAAPTTDDLRTAATAAYDAAEQAGLVVSDQSFAKAAVDIADAVRQAGIDRTIHPKATAALARIEEAVGQPLSLKDLDILRRVVKSAAASPEADERRIANIMIDGLDNYVSSLSHMDVVAGDPMRAASEINRARDLWSRMRKSEMIEEAVLKAERRAASTGSGGNTDNAIRQNIRAILDNPKKRRGFTADEIEMMEAVVKGGPLQNLLRLVGKLSPQGNGLMAALGIGGTAVNPMLAAAPAAGFVAKNIADRATPQRIQALLGAVRRGGAPTPAAQLSPTQRAILEAMIIGGAQQAPNLLPGR